MQNLLARAGTYLERGRHVQLVAVFAVWQQVSVANLLAQRMCDQMISHAGRARHQGGEAFKKLIEKDWAENAEALARAGLARGK